MLFEKNVSGFLDDILLKAELKKDRDRKSVV